MPAAAVRVAVHALLRTVRGFKPDIRERLIDGVALREGRPTALYLRQMLALPPERVSLTPALARRLLREWPLVLGATAQVRCARALFRWHVESQHQTLYIWVRSDGEVRRTPTLPLRLKWPEPWIEACPWLTESAVDAGRLHWGTLVRERFDLNRRLIRRTINRVQQALHTSHGRMQRFEFDARLDGFDVHVFAGTQLYPPPQYIEAMARSTPALPPPVGAS